MKKLALPIIIGGERVEPAHDGSGTVDLPCANGNVVRLPALTPALVDQILAADTALSDVPVQSIISFLANVGHNWKSSEYARRRLYVTQLQKFRGYSEKMAENEANWIALLLSSHYRLYDTLTTELGDWHLVDDWVVREEAHVKALPRGRVMHILPGNVPLSSVVSIVRALVTKNTCIAKVAADDPLTAISLALSFRDVDANHPASRAMSVVYWPSGTEEGIPAPLFEAADAICAWGGDDAMRAASRYARPEAEILKFGPRRSVALVDTQKATDAELTTAARALAHDVCMYEQRACFSMRQVFVVGPSESLVEKLKVAFENYRNLVPKGFHDDDELACATFARTTAEFSGAVVHSAPDASWSLVECAPWEVDEMHPLGRTLYLHSLSAADEIGNYLDRSVQTLGVFPWKLGHSVRDVAARRGVGRLVEVGLNNVFRVGGAHEGMYPLQRLVRLVSQELPAASHIKGITVALDLTKFLEENRFVEFIP